MQWFFFHPKSKFITPLAFLFIYIAIIQIKELERGKGKKMTNKIGFICLYVCFYFNSFGQISDSAWSRWDSIYSVAHEFLSNNPDSTLYIAKKYIKWAYLVEDQFEIAYANDLLGSAYYYTNNLDSAIYHHHIAYDYFLALEDSIELGSTLINLGNAYSDIGYYVKGINYYLNSLEIQAAVGEEEETSVAICNIASIFSDQKDYLNSEYYARSALKIARRKKNNTIIASASNLIGEMLIRKGKLDSAELVTSEAFKLSTKENLALDIASSLGNFGLIDQQKGLFKEAKEHFQRAINIAKNYNDPYSVVLQQNLMIDLFLEIGQNDSARILGIESYRLAKTTSKSRFMLMESTFRLSKVYEASNRPNLALSNLQDYVLYLDTLRNLNAKEAILAQNNIAIEKQNNLLNKNITLEKEASKNNQLFLLITLSFLGVGFALIILLFFLIQRGKKLNKNLKSKNDIILSNQKEIDDRKQEVLQKNMVLNDLIHNKDKLLAILTHDLKQPFNQLHYMLELLHLNVFQGQEKDDMLFDMKISLQNTRNTIDNLLIWSKSQFGGFEWKPAVVDLNKLALEIREQLKDQYKIASLELITQLDQKAVNALIDKEQILIALRNLLNNSMKFSEKGSSVEIRTYLRDNFACIEIVDHGTGMSQAQVEKLNGTNKQIMDLGNLTTGGTGIGVLIVNEFIDNNNGRLSIKSELGKGSSFTISFPQNS